MNKFILIQNLNKKKPNNKNKNEMNYKNEKI